MEFHSTHGHHHFTSFGLSRLWKIDAAGRKPGAQAIREKQGITPGWGDIYDFYLPDQYIDVSGVADGLYALETIADPDNALAEADESNNCTSIPTRALFLSDMCTSVKSSGPQSIPAIGVSCEPNDGRNADRT